MICNEDDVGGQATVTRDEERVLYTHHHDARPIHTRVHMHTSVNKHCLAR